MGKYDVRQGYVGPPVHLRLRDPRDQFGREVDGSGTLKLLLGVEIGRIHGLFCEKLRSRIPQCTLPPSQTPTPGQKG